MNKKALLAVLLSLTSFPALADETMFEQAYMREQAKSVTLVRDLPDYFSKDVPLSKTERESLKAAEEWAKNPSKPIRLPSGKVSFLHGASVPTIIASPMNICDLEFEPGESIQSMMLGDTARWQVDSGTVGNVPHVFIKPFDSGLETSAVITTSKRVYHLRLVSQRKGHMPYVGWIYPENSFVALQQQKQKEERQAQFNTTEISPGKAVDLSSLDFRYKVEGKAAWKPVQVYNDGLKTYIRLPDNVQEAPVLLAKHQGDVLVNYRFNDGTFIVDGIFTEITLLLGVGSKQEKVTVKRS